MFDHTLYVSVSCFGSLLSDRLLGTIGGGGQSGPPQDGSDLSQVSINLWQAHLQAFDAFGSLPSLLGKAAPGEQSIGDLPLLGWFRDDLTRSVEKIFDDPLADWLCRPYALAEQSSVIIFIDRHDVNLQLALSPK